MKRSSSVPEIMTAGPSPLSLQTRRGISTSQISLPNDLLRPAPSLGGPTCVLDGSSPRRGPPFSPIPLARLNSPTSRPNRVEQLRKEECIDERPSEKEVMEITNLNQSYDELRVDTIEVMDMWPLHPSPSHQSPFISPSSPLAKLGTRSRSLTPTSPLPNRTYCRRSCSPVLRPSQLWAGQKRKREESYHDADMDTSPSSSYPAKRFQSTHRAISPPSLSPAISPLTGNSPLYHSSRKSSSQSESTPLSSPPGLQPSGLTFNPFATNYDGGNCELWQNSSASSGSGHSAQTSLLLNSTTALRENGAVAKVFDEQKKISISAVVSGGELRNYLHIDPPAPPDPNAEGYVPTPLSPKGLQFRQRPFPLPSSTLPSPVPRTVLVSTTATPPTPVRSSPVLIPKSVLQHDKYLSPFNSELPYSHSHSHSHPHTHSHTHRHLHPLRSHLSTSTVGTVGHRFAAKLDPSTSEMKTASTFPGRQGTHSPLSKLSVSATHDDTQQGSGACPPSGPGAAAAAVHGMARRDGRNGRIGRKRKESEASSSDGREENMMESDGSFAESCDEGVELTPAKGQ